MIGRLLRILCVSLLLASGCSSSAQDRREISNVLKIRASALNSRDMAQYLSAVSARYNDKGKDFIQLKESLERNFADFTQLSYEADKQTITVAGNSAEAVGDYRMKIQVRGKEMKLNGTEHLKLTKEPEGWKIIAGI